MEDLGGSLETAGAAALEMAVSATLERGGKVVPCRNCAAPVFGAYCAACGQPTDVHRRSLLRLLQDLFRDIASFDSRILRTIRALFFEPGELPLAFREGRTQRYVPPVRLYLFVSLFFFLFLSVTGIAILQMELGATPHRIFTDGGGRVFEEKNGVTNVLEGLKADPDGNVFADGGKGGPRVPIYGMKADGKVVNDLSTNALFFSPAIMQHHQLSSGLRSVLDRQHALLAGMPIGSSFKTWLVRHLDRVLQMLATDPAAINGPLTEWIPRTLFVLLPVFALLLAVFYWRQRRDFYFVDHLVFSLNMHSFAFAIILVAIILARVIARDTAAEFAILAVALYLFLAMNRFYRQGWIWTAVKFALVSFVYGAFFLAPALAGILVASLLYL
ncbi:MAG TPA: DUF3667 domain-containing protein [Rhizomicrobium sp.]|nr:DUF3667 domain-containing protein [Rhizomicrobium sp.]